MNHLIISDNSITQDSEGRYCLNDLHRAAGGQPKHKPANFMRLDSTIALVAEINRCSEVSNAFATMQGGSLQGTFVCKELVYAYAMWISPAFSLRVIRAFDALVTGQSVGGDQGQNSALADAVYAMSRLAVSNEKLVNLLVERMTQPEVEPIKRRAPVPLTDEEKDTLIRLLAKGLSQNAIAAELNRSPATVSKYVAIVRAGN